MKPVLLLVDLQNDYLAAPELHPPADAVVTRAAELLDHCRRHRIPVIHVWTTLRRDKDRRLPHWERTNRWMCVAGTERTPTSRPAAAARGRNHHPQNRLQRVCRRQRSMPRSGG